MSIDVEDQVRAALHEMADEARSAPLLQRLERDSVRPPTWRTSALVAAAASVLAVAILAASLAWVRVHRSAVVEPAVDPPKVFRLSDTETADPGVGAMLVVLADANAQPFVHEKPAYLLPIDGKDAVLVDESDDRAVWTEHLSQDGTRVVRQTDVFTGSTSSIPDSGLEIVDLRTGKVDDLDGVGGACPALSPDNRALAAYGLRDIRVIELPSGRTSLVRRLAPDADPQICGALAWSPDSTRLLVPSGAGSRLIDREGRTLSRLPGLRAVNGSMSWSPDGRSVLLYDRQDGRYLTRELDGDDTVLSAPDDATKPVGWAGSRIVWLAGSAGDGPRLTTTDERGGDPRLWTRLRTRGMAVETVSWSTPLRGSARD